MALEPLRDSGQFALNTFAQIQEIYIAIRNRIYDAKLTAKKQYDKNRVDRDFKPGELVWLYTSSSDRSAERQVPPNLGRAFPRRAKTRRRELRAQEPPDRGQT